MFVCGTPLATDEGHGRTCSNPNFAKAQGAAEGSRLRRHADRADALDRPAGADQPRAGRQVAAGEGAASRSTCSRWTGRRWSRRRAKKDPPDQGGWNAFLTSWVVGRHPQSGDGRLLQRRLRQGDVRLAVRREDREAARRVRRARPIRPSRRRSPTAVQERWAEIIRRTSTSASGISRSRVRKNVDGILIAPAPVFWNVTKK